MEAVNKDEVNVLKGMAIIGVVGLHFLSAMPWLSLYHGLVFDLSLVVDLFLRFSVPMFVALSGYALAARYANSELKLAEFYRHRVVKLVPLYILWTGVIYLVAQLYAPWAGFVNSANIWERILLGRGDYHLYFVPMIFQLYVLFPGLLWLVRRWGRAVLLVSLLVQCFIYIGFAGWGWSDQLRYVISFSWIFYFVLGIYFSGWKKLSGLKMLGGLGLALGFGWATFQAFIEILFGKNIIDVTTFTTLPILVFSSGFIMAAFAAVPQLGIGILRKLLIYCGEKSYLIYLSHTLVLRVVLGVGVSPLSMVVPLVLIVLALGVSGRIK